MAHAHTKYMENNSKKTHSTLAQRLCAAVRKIFTACQKDFYCTVGNIPRVQSETFCMYSQKHFYSACGKIFTIHAKKDLQMCYKTLFPINFARVAVLAVLLCVCGAASAWGQSNVYYWVGGTDNNWNTKENWKYDNATTGTTANEYPGANAGAEVHIEPNAATTVTLNVSLDGTAGNRNPIKSITLNNNATFVIGNSNLTVTDTWSNGAGSLNGTTVNVTTPGGTVQIAGSYNRNNTSGTGRVMLPANTQDFGTWEYRNTALRDVVEGIVVYNKIICYTANVGRTVNKSFFVGTLNLSSGTLRLGCDDAAGQYAMDGVTVTVENMTVSGNGYFSANGTNGITITNELKLNDSGSFLLENGTLKANTINCNGKEFNMRGTNNPQFHIGIFNYTRTTDNFAFPANAVINGYNGAGSNTQITNNGNLSFGNAITINGTLTNDGTVNFANSATITTLTNNASKEINFTGATPTINIANATNSGTITFDGNPTVLGTFSNDASSTVNYSLKNTNAITLSNSLFNNSYQNLSIGKRSGDPAWTSAKTVTVNGTLNVQGTLFMEGHSTAQLLNIRGTSAQINIVNHNTSNFVAPDRSNVTITATNTGTAPSGGTYSWSTNIRYAADADPNEIKNGWYVPGIAGYYYWKSSASGGDWGTSRNWEMGTIYATSSVPATSAPTSPDAKVIFTTSANITSNIPSTVARIYLRGSTGGTEVILNSGTQTLTVSEQIAINSDLTNPTGNATLNLEAISVISSTTTVVGTGGTLTINGNTAFEANGTWTNNNGTVNVNDNGYNTSSGAWVRLPANAANVSEEGTWIYTNTTNANNLIPIAYKNLVIRQGEINTNSTSASVKNGGTLTVGENGGSSGTNAAVLNVNSTLFSVNGVLTNYANGTINVQNYTFELVHDSSLTSSNSGRINLANGTSSRFNINARFVNETNGTLEIGNGYLSLNYNNTYFTNNGTIIMRNGGNLEPRNDMNTAPAQNSRLQENGKWIYENRDATNRDARHLANLRNNNSSYSVGYPFYDLEIIGSNRVYINSYTTDMPVRVRNKLTVGGNSNTTLFDLNNQHLTLENRATVEIASGGTMEIGASALTATGATINNSGTIRVQTTANVNTTPANIRNYTGSTVEFYGTGDAEVSKMGTTFHHLTVTATATRTVTFNGTTTVNGNMALNGADTSSRITIDGTNNANIVINANAGSGTWLNINYDNVSINASTFSPSFDATNYCFDGTGNRVYALHKGWQFPAGPVTGEVYYWVVGNGNWSDVANWQYGDATGPNGTTANEYPGAKPNAEVHIKPNAAATVTLNVSLDGTAGNGNLINSIELNNNATFVIGDKNLSVIDKWTNGSGSLNGTTVNVNVQGGTVQIAGNYNRNNPSGTGRVMLPVNTQDFGTWEYRNTDLRDVVEGIVVYNNFVCSVGDRSTRRIASSFTAKTITLSSGTLGIGCDEQGRQYAMSGVTVTVETMTISGTGYFSANGTNSLTVTDTLNHNGAAFVFQNGTLKANIINCGNTFNMRGNASAQFNIETFNYTNGTVTFPVNAVINGYNGTGSNTQITNNGNLSFGNAITINGNVTNNATNTLTFGNTANINGTLTNDGTVNFANSATITTLTNNASKEINFTGATPTINITGGTNSGTVNIEGNPTGIVNVTNANGSTVEYKLTAANVTEATVNFGKTYGDLKCNVATAGKTLKFDGTITVQGSMTLTGTSANHLTIDGTNNANIVINTNAGNGTWLNINYDNVMVNATTFSPSYDATQNCFDKDGNAQYGLLNGWKFADTSKYYWAGGDGNWSDFSRHWRYGRIDGGVAKEYPGTNADAEVYITTGETVTLNTTLTKALKTLEMTTNSTLNLEAGLNVADTIAIGNATTVATLDLVNFDISATTITNNGTVRLHGTQNVTATTIDNNTNSTVEYYGAGTGDVSKFGNSYYDLKCDLTGTSAGKTLVFPANSTTNVDGDLILRGANENVPLTIAAGSGGTATITVTKAQGDTTSPRGNYLNIDRANVTINGAKIGDVGSTDYYYWADRSYDTDTTPNALAEVRGGWRIPTLKVENVVLSVSPLGGNNLFVRSSQNTMNMLSSAPTTQINMLLQRFFKVVDNSGSDVNGVSISKAELVRNGSAATWIKLTATVTGSTVLTDIAGLQNYYIATATNIDASGATPSITWDYHPISDFAVGAVTPLFAYDNRYQSGSGDWRQYSENSLAIRNWNKDQGSNGSLLFGQDITLSVNFMTGIGAPQIYLTNDSVNHGFLNRVWAPITSSSDWSNGLLLPVPSSVNSPTSGIAVTGNNVRYDFTNATYTSSWNWKDGDQVSFMFGVTDATTGNLINVGGGNGTTAHPLYALRLQNANDINTLDVWSFRLRTMTAQRGGVSILNNVIDANSGEHVTVQVDMNGSGPVNVIVMTLDGDVVTYLHHGSLSSGRHLFQWDGRTNSGRAVARGLYWVRVTGSGFDETRKVLVIKE